ncbi:hypothetical protein BCT86_00185 [Vibrio breoganii]|uniref:glycosyltransferase family 2 protein n=1 Tax=Vibrio breoganii TaxID=553239 RepID=UPI000C82CE9F|nr:glycosyltransferase family 2 protein [Vibrio breoganii]PML10631.1 hypothetical protein BCT86_00185 [Vibrio breoganii]
MKDIDVVMATYNGEAFITEQLQSIVDCRGFNEHVNRIIISDDNSTDSTMSIVKEFKSDAIEFYSNTSTKGVIGNFNNAAGQSSAKYVVFSDQDDVWLKNKIDILYKGITDLESGNESIPSLFFTDLEVVGQSLEPIATSFWKHQNLDPRLTESLSSILVQNVTPGCAIIVNRALLDIAFPCPIDAVMHDWWLLLCARSFGKVSYSESQTVKYRQHDHNAIGASQMTFIQKVARVLKGTNDTFSRIVKQSRLLKELVPNNNPYYNIINQVSQVKNLSTCSRIRLFTSLITPYHSIERKMAIFVRVLTLK